MNSEDKLKNTIEYLHTQMVNDGVLMNSKEHQVQYVLDMLSILNDGKIDMMDDIIGNIEKLGYREEHMIALYSKLLSYVADADKIL